jgi:hypothetical protein
MIAHRCLAGAVLLAVLSTGAHGQEVYPLAGVWNCEGPMYRSQIIFQPNGQYSAQAVAPQGYNITHWGQWRMVGPTWARLVLQGWSPREYLGNPIRMPSEDNFTFQPTGPGQLATPDGSRCIRAQ